MQPAARTRAAKRPQLEPERKGLWATYEGANRTLHSPVVVVRIAHLDSHPALPRRTKLTFSLGLAAIGAIGLYVSDKLEERYPTAEAGA